MNRNQYGFGILLCGLILACISAAPGQSAPSNSGTILGNVRDTQGAAIQAAQVSLRSLADNRRFEATTQPDGTFHFNLLPPGNYEITVRAANAATNTTTVTVRANSAEVLTIRMLSASAGQSSSAVSGVVNSTSVRELPLNGRSASDLAALEPGVATARTQSSGQGQYGFGTQMTISGARPRQNDSRLDGISENDYSNGPPGSALGFNLGAEAVEQFSVLTSNYPANLGRSSGGIIGSTTRSGTDHFHGDVYEFLRNSALDARNYFDTTKPPFRRNQFGGSLGGPLIRRRTYFFMSYEGLRQSLGVTQVDTVPSQAARAGMLSTGTITVDPSISRFLTAFFPLPNSGLLGTGDTGLYRFSGQEVTPENFFTLRLDHNFTKSDVLSGTYLFDSGNVQQPDELGNKRTGYDSRRQLISFHETHSGSDRWTNSFRIGLNRVVADTGLTFTSGNAAAGDPTYGTVPGENAAAVTVPGLTAFSGGLQGLSNFHFHWTSFQIYDDVSYHRGKHALQFGFSVERDRDNIVATTVPSGQFTFNSLQDFLVNQPFSLVAALPGALSGRGFRQTILGAYMQDNWHVTSHLALNLGLRYETATVPTEVQNKLTTLRGLTDASPHLGAPLFANPTLRNLEPRIGVTWNPSRLSNTVLRSGFGIFDVLPLPYEIQMNELFSAPYFDFGNVTNLPALSYPTDAFTIVAGSPSTFRQAYFDPQPRRNYVMQWNLTIEQPLPRGLDMRVGYVGSRGIHQPFRVEDADIVLPQLTGQGYLWPAPIGSGQRLNLNAGRVTAGFWRGDSYYHALQVQLKKQARWGQVGGSYTFGKSLDTSSGSLVGDEYANSISSPLFFNPGLNRGLSDFNVAQNLETHYTWELPSTRTRFQDLNWAGSGWQLGGVLAASSGVPFTPGFAGDALGLKSTDPNVDLPDLMLTPGCANPVNAGNPVHYIRTNCFQVPASVPSIAPQCVPVVNTDPLTGQQVPVPGTCLNLRGNLGRNTLIGPGLVSFDFSVFKNNPMPRISKTFNLQFRAEFFNVINRANFAPPLSNRDVFDAGGHAIANAGLIVATQTPAREIQFALKILW